ncbi:uncharacterized protein, partial [Rutidosis leptorrhynchoides]|uniref:uncharacterized protein n=1 Tax=Rutidosis leptorrhynchoides TaxID=125765 RepID=UPI003A98EBE8
MSLTNHTSTITPSSDFYLHSNENPTQALISPLLNINNYHTWSRSMSIALKSKAKFNFINGKITKHQEDDSTFSDWDRCYITVSYVQKEIANLKQGDLNIFYYYTKIRTLWDEYDDLRPIPECECSIKCECKALKVIAEYYKNDEIIRFLKGLNHVYAQTRSTILMLDPIPSLQKVFATVFQYESQNILSLEPEESTLAAFSATKPPAQSPALYQYKKTPDGKPICSHFSKFGHIVAKCFRIVGFPPNFKFTKAPSTNQKNVSSNMAATEPAEKQNESIISISNDEYESEKADTCKLSVSNLYSNCILMVYSTKCLMQDLTSMRMIGSARQRKGLYFVDLAENYVFPRISCNAKMSSTNNDRVERKHLHILNVGELYNFKEPDHIENEHEALLDITIDVLDTLPEPLEPEIIEQPIVRKSIRHKFTSKHLEDYHCNLIISLSQQDRISFLKDSSSIHIPDTPHSIENHFAFLNLSQNHLVFTLKICCQEEPDSFKQAIESENWQTAIENELRALAEKNMVFKLKHKAHRSIERYKVRLLAKGYTKKEGIDYSETFSPVAKFTTIKILLGVAASKGWYLTQLDINNPFLHNDLDEELAEALMNFGYSQSSSDNSLFIHSSNESFTAILIYVDDLIIAGNDMQQITLVKDFLYHKFSSKPASTPMIYSPEFLNTSPKLEDASIYRKFIGKLFYLTHTRPDISQSTHFLSQFLIDPTIAHLQAAHRIRCILQGLQVIRPQPASLYCDNQSAIHIALRNETEIYSRNVEEVLRRGFLLKWLASDCSHCEETGIGVTMKVSIAI